MLRFIGLCFVFWLLWATGLLQLALMVAAKFLFSLAVLLG